MHLTMQCYWAIRDFHEVAPPALMAQVRQFYHQWLCSAADFQLWLSPDYIPNDLKNAFDETFLWMIGQQAQAPAAGVGEQEAQDDQTQGDQDGGQGPENQEGDA
jgi:hypothetical protein